MADNELDRLLDGFLDLEEEMKATQRNQSDTNDDAARSKPEPKYDTETNCSLYCDRNFFTSKCPQETRVSFNHPTQISGQSYWHGRGISTSDSVAGAQYSSFGAPEVSRPSFFLGPVVASRSDFSRTDDNQANLSSRQMEHKNARFGATTYSRTIKENIPSECLPERKIIHLPSMPPPRMSAGREKRAAEADTAENDKLSSTSAAFSQTEDISKFGMTAERHSFDFVSAAPPSGIQTLSQPTGKVKEFLCEFCGTFFRFKSNLKRHRIIHTGEKRCKKCGQIFADSNALTEHSLIHYKKLYECSVCQKKLVSKYKLKVHFRIHTKERPFTCDICHKAFGRKDHLATHVRFHSGERPYKCKVCGSGFTTKQNCTRHQKEVHDIK